jgi:hypothetical protein
MNAFVGVWPSLAAFLIASLGGALGRYAAAAVFVGLGLFTAASGGRGLR